MDDHTYSVMWKEEDKGRGKRRRRKTVPFINQQACLFLTFALENNETTGIYRQAYSLVQ